MLEALHSSLECECGVLSGVPSDVQFIKRNPRLWQAGSQHSKSQSIHISDVLQALLQLPGNAIHKWLWGCKEPQFDSSTPAAGRRRCSSHSRSSTSPIPEFPKEVKLGLNFEGQTGKQERWEEGSYGGEGWSGGHWSAGYLLHTYVEQKALVLNLMQLSLSREAHSMTTQGRIAMLCGLKCLTT